MPVRRKKGSSIKERKFAKFSQSQILYALLLVAVFLIGYLLGTLQAIKNPSSVGQTSVTSPSSAPQAAVPSFTNDDIKTWAKNVGLDSNKFASCFDASKYQSNVDKDVSEGSTAGVSGTPTFYVNGVQLVGSLPYDDFKKTIDQELSGGSTAQKTNVDVGQLPVLGQESAPVTIVEFSDLECPFCARFFNEAFVQIKKDYIDTGKVKMYFRHFPLPFHPLAKPYANATECANEQGKFWELHDEIFSQQK